VHLRSITDMEFRYSPSAAARLIVPITFFIGGGYFLTRFPGAAARFWGWLGLGMGLAAALWTFVLLLFRRGVVVIIDERGIEDRQMGFGLIPWTEIRGAYVTEMGNGKGRFLSIVVDHPETYLAKTPIHKRLLARLNAAFPAIQKVMINFSLLEPEVEVALLLIKRELARLGEARPAGRCVVCGYDLRETPERCPECGHKV
jgi:hypothetical protein